MQEYDVLVIGGGITGAGIARDASGRGLRVLLVDSYDIASGTSSWSSKLLHGGIRYLEQYNFSLVRESLEERSVMAHVAPHLAWPSEFRIPYKHGNRSRLILRIGIALYDYLAGNNHLFPKGNYISSKHWPQKNPELIDEIQCGLHYSDCRTNDSRVTVETVMGAVSTGAHVRTYTTIEAVENCHDHWQVRLAPKLQADSVTIGAKIVVNATGPWVGQDETSDFQAKYAPDLKPSLVQGSHFLVPALYKGSHSYLLQAHDGRVVFVVPFENNYSLVGTTEVTYKGNPRECTISKDEQNYLLIVLNSYFSKPVQASDIVWSFSGVRALIPSDKSISTSKRDYYFDIRPYNDCWWSNTYGGKLTSYRSTSEKIVDTLMSTLKKKHPGWTKDSPLPGGELPEGKDHLAIFKKRYYWLDELVLARLFYVYGSRIALLLQHATKTSDLGRHIAGGVYQLELRYAVNQEIVCKGADFLTRRTRLFLTLSQEEQQKITDEIERIVSENKT